jgi:hypothetical protein
MRVGAELLIRFSTRELAFGWTNRTDSPRAMSKLR